MTAFPAQLARPLAARTRALPAAPAPSAAATEADAVIAAGAQALADGKTHYTDRPGIGPLRELLARWTGPLEIKADQFTITCGVEEARYVALKTLVPAGGRVLVLGDAAPIAAAAGLLELELATAGADAQAAYGGPAALLTLLAGNVPLPGWLICELADPQRDLADHAAALRVAAAAREALKQTVFIGELPEMAGWRVGFMAGSSAAGKLRAFKQSMTICTPSVSQWAALGIEES